MKNNEYIDEGNFKFLFKSPSIIRLKKKQTQLQLFKKKKYRE